MPKELPLSISSCTPEEATAFADELTELSKQQSQALQQAAYFRMTLEESKAWDERHVRIGDLCRLLGKYKP
ncbi:MAG TPA: hypothetical protein VLK33_05255 [Terriglobales bacterium]|nr:hypothetical protein [Terriglobales bacterium]